MLNPSALKCWLPLLILCFLPFALKAQSKEKVVLHFAGDVLLADHFEKHVNGRMQYAFEKMPWFAEADISMVNLENPITTRGRKREKAYNFRAKPRYVQVLKEGGIDIVTLANNHAYDYGRDGLIQTMHVLDSARIFYVGAGRTNVEARKPVLFRVNGLRIAFLAYYGLKKHSDCQPAGAEQSGTALRNLRYIREDIHKLRHEADFIIVSFHWGLQKKNYPQQSQIEFAHRTIEYGADLVVGHHPHVLQGIERYQKRVIAYSLGNFIFGGNSRTHEKTGVLKVSIPTRNPKQYDCELIPVSVDYWQPSRLNGAEADTLLNRVKAFSSVFPQSIFEK